MILHATQHIQITYTCRRRRGKGWLPLPSCWCPYNLCVRTTGLAALAVFSIAVFDLFGVTMGCCDAVQVHLAIAQSKCVLDKNVCKWDALPPGLPSLFSKPVVPKSRSTATWNEPLAYNEWEPQLPSNGAKTVALAEKPGWGVAGRDKVSSPTRSSAGR